MWWRAQGVAEAAVRAGLHLSVDKTGKEPAAT